MITVQDAQQLHQAYKTSPIYANNQLRFAYGGRGETIGDYLKAFPQAETTLRKVDSITKLNLWVFKNSEKYARFAQHSNPASIIEDIKYWFRGQIGEWFILDVFLQGGNQFTVRDVDKNHLGMESLYNVTPTIYTGCADFGVDGIATDKNNNGVVIQVKFWNPWASKLMVDYHMVSATSDQGTTEGWIDARQEKSIYFFWLGSKHHGSIFNNMSKYLMSQDCPLTKYKKVLYIDGQDLMTNTPIGFWSNNFQNAIQLLY